MLIIEIRQKLTMFKNVCLFHFASFFCIIQAFESATSPEKQKASDPTVCRVLHFFSLT